MVEIFRLSIIISSVGCWHLLIWIVVPQSLAISTTFINILSNSFSITSHISEFSDTYLIPACALMASIVWLCNNLARLDVNPSKNLTQFKAIRNEELHIIWSRPSASVIDLRSHFLVSSSFWIMVSKQVMNSEQGTKIKNWGMSFYPSCVAKKLDLS